MARSLRRGGALLATTLMVAPLALATPTFAAEGDTVTIFGINDYHGRLATNGKNLACTLEVQRAAVPESGTSFFVSAGDNIGGTEFTSFIQQDNPTIDYLNALELDTTAVGNHEFDAGFADLEGRVTERSNYPQLGANVYKADGSRALPAYSIHERDGVRIAVIGAVTEQTPSLVSPAGVAGIEFREPVAEVNRVVEELKASDQNIDIFVAAYHDGAPSNAAPGVPPSGELLHRIQDETSSSVALILTGHTHRTYNYIAPLPDGSGSRAIVQAGDYGTNLAAVTFREQADGSYTVVQDDVKLHATTRASDSPDCTTFPRYNEAANIIDQARTTADQLGNQEIGTLSADVTTAWNAQRAEYVNGVWSAKEGERERGRGDDRSASSSLGNMAADSQVWALAQDSYPGQTPDIGVMGPGSLRADLMFDDEGKDGVITYKEANDVMPFANNVHTIDLSGAQFVEVLEQQWQPEGASRAYLQLGLSSNVTYTFDATAQRGSRITDVWINGEPLDPARVYTVVGQSFLLDGGDNFTAFNKGTNRVDTGLLDRDTWVDYIKANSPLTPAFAQRGVGMTDVTPSDAPASELVYRFTYLHSTSLGAPQINEVRVNLGGQVFSAPYTFNDDLGTYAADVTISARCLAAGSYVGEVRANPDLGTMIVLGFEVSGQATLPEDCASVGSPAPSPQPTEPGKPSPSPSPAPNPEDPPAGGPITISPGDNSMTLPRDKRASHVNDGQVSAAIQRTGATIAPYALGALALIVFGGTALVARHSLSKK